MQTTKLSLRAQSIVMLIYDAMTDLALELGKDYKDVDVKLTVDADLPVSANDASAHLREFGQLRSELRDKGL